MSTLNDLVKEEFAFLWIVPASVPNIEQAGCSSISIFLYAKAVNSINRSYIII